MRLDFSRERRTWEDEKARSAPPEPLDWTELDTTDDAYELSGQVANFSDLPEASQASVNAMELSQQGQEEDEAEMMRLQEEREMEELLALMDEQENTQTSSTYGSDEDDYDGLFMELLEKDQSEQHASGAVHEDEMDTSGG